MSTFPELKETTQVRNTWYCCANMCEVTRHNFNALFPKIQETLQKCKFIGIDLEFSALVQKENNIYSFFDTPAERYAKMRTNLEHIVPLQIGLTAFAYNNVRNDYFGETFTFHVSPPSFIGLDKLFECTASTMVFLNSHKFDWNKFAYSGIPYLSRQEEAEFKEKLKREDFFDGQCELDCMYEDALDVIYPLVLHFYQQSKLGDSVEIEKVAKLYDDSVEVKYALHKLLRARFRHIWTSEEQGKFHVKRVTEEERLQLSQSCHMDADFMTYLTGFSRVFQLLTDLQKPMVGHNLMQDLMIIYNVCQAPLPSSYKEFKNAVHALFPVIYDTKSLFYELRQYMPKEKAPIRSSLEELFTYFKDGLGRQLTPNQIVIDSDITGANLGHYHEAGWDSYCAGYIFIRLGHFNVVRNYSPRLAKSKEVLFLEMVNPLSDIRNRVNIIQGSTNYINFEGEDPASCRPPWLQILSEERIDMDDLTPRLNSYGRFQLRKVNKKQVLVAVDNFRTFRDVLADLRVEKKYKVREHHPAVTSLLLPILLAGSLTFSATFVLWLLYKSTKN